MEKLDILTIEDVRKMEKEHDTYRPKEIWVRAWQIMLERHEHKKHKENFADNVIAMSEEDKYE